MPSAKRTAKRQRKLEKKEARQAPPSPKRGVDPFGGLFERVAIDPSEFAPDVLAEFKAEAVRFADDEDDSKFQEVIDSLSLTLNIKISRASVPVGPGMLNVRASEAAVVESIGFYEPRVFKRDGEDDDDEDDSDEPFLPVSDGALDRVVTTRKYILVKGSRTHPVCYSRDGPWRARDVMSAFLDYELVTRVNTEWFGGIDIHHVMLDEASYQAGVVSVHWGS